MDYGDELKYLEDNLFNILSDIKIKERNNDLGSGAKLLSSHGVDVKIGNKLETFWGNEVDKSPVALNLISKNSNNKNKIVIAKNGKSETKQLDLLFQINTNVYYFEMKNNLDFDTEKEKATYEKIYDVEKHLKSIYSFRNINAGIFSATKSKLNLPDCIKKQETKTLASHFLSYGVEDMISLLKITAFTAEDYLKCIERCYRNFQIKINVINLTRLAPEKQDLNKIFGIMTEAERDIAKKLFKGDDAKTDS